MNSLRLDRLLSNLGYGSRKEIALLVRARRIKLHGQPITKADQPIALSDAAGGMLTFDDEPVDPPSPLAIMLNKPPGYTCSHDERGLLVYDLLPPRFRIRKPALSCAGRLDKESTGQVIMTDDGDLLHRIIHPKSHAEKHYHVTLDRPLSGNETALFAPGDFLMKGDTKPLKPAQWVQETPTTGHMTLHEGRFHQIRRMFDTLGNEVTALHRYRTGNLELGSIEPGQYRVLKEDDLWRIFACD
jgi:16S rRNA pseudouridine516 synthase